MRRTIPTVIMALLAGTCLAGAQEAPDMHEGHLQRLDADNDGGVSREEYRAFMIEGFAKLDKNADAVLLESEVTEVLSPRQFNRNGRQ